MVSGAYFRPGNSHLSVLYVYQRKGTPQEAEEKGSRCGDRDFVSQSFYERMWCGCGTGEENVSMALGVDASEEGICLTYGMPDLSESTGQGKEEEDGGSRVLQISGADFTRIEKMYDQSQEKLLDMGHLQVLVMGRTLVEDGRWRMMLDYLKQEIFVGEDLYVFEAEDVGEILNWHGEDNSSAGEYITGLIRNRMSGGNITAVTLRELFYEKYKEDKILRLPIVKIRNGSLEVEV